MKHKSLLFCFVVFCICGLLSCGNKQGEKNTIRIATSANMHATMRALVAEFEEQSQIPCEIIVGSSGKLTAQIKEGAPYDIFVAADMKYPQELYVSGKTSAIPKPYAYGKLVLWTTSKEILPSIDILSDKTIEHIALANPKTAPYGSASMEALKYFGIYDQIKEKLVYGENISQTNQFILSQSAEIGLTAKSVVLTPELRETGQWTPISDESYAPIVQGAVLLKQTHELKKGAEIFYNFLYSKAAKVILTKYGYTVDE